MRKKNFVCFMITVLLIFFVFRFNIVAKATEQFLPTIPDFPACPVPPQVGDYAHTVDGIYEVPGDANYYQGGQDDVFSLDGNYLQCLCQSDGTGIQTIYWNIGDYNFDQEDLEYYFAQDFVLAIGSEWDLPDTLFLARNTNYDCSDRSFPTPTPIPTPTSEPKPEEESEEESQCTGLTANVYTGTAPLTVEFNASGYDPSGDIKEYEFDFGDDSGGQPRIWRQDGSVAYHRYENPGTYKVAVKVKDSAGNWREKEGDCTLEIEVSKEPQVLGMSNIGGLPDTGASVLPAILLIVLASLGVNLYRRFRVA